MPGKTVLDYVPTWLPVLIAILALLAFGVRADANITEIQEKVVIYDKMIIDSTDRMARVETKLGGIEAGQSRIEAKIDSL
jgi:hypothetical protein